MSHIATIEFDAGIFREFSKLVLQQGTKLNISNNPFLFAKAYEIELIKALPGTTLQIISDMREKANPGIIHVKNLPKDDVPTGLDVKERNSKKTRLSEAIILAIATLLDCHMEEGENGYIHNISYAVKHKNTLSSLSRDPIYYHIETAYATKIPRFLMLVCLEDDPKARTSYFPIAKILKDIPPTILATMRKAFFQISAVPGRDDNETIICPILEIEQNNMETFRFYEAVDRILPAPNLNETQKSEVNACLKFLTQHSQKIFPKTEIEHYSVSLKPGEALIVNNGWAISGNHYGVMHGRTGNIENPNRWLQRGIFYFNTQKIRSNIDAGYLSFLAGS